MNLESLFNNIAPAQALQFTPTHYADGELELSAPLAPNRNDKGTAFAGSIASILLLAGWGVITLRLREAGVAAEVMAVKSETEYTAPVRAAFKAVAVLSEAEAERILNDLKTKRRSRTRIQSRLLSEGGCCAAFTADYAVFAKGP